MNVEQLVAANYDWLIQKARRLCLNIRDAEDLCGDTVLKLLAVSDRFDQCRSFKPWASVVMLNTFKTWYQRRKCVDFVGISEDYAYVASDRADQRAIVADVMRAIAELEKRHVCIGVVKLFTKGYAAEEIAQMLDIPIGTVRQRLCIGRKLIKAVLLSQM